MTAHGEAVIQVDSAMDEEARPGSAMHCVTAMSSSEQISIPLQYNVKLVFISDVLAKVFRHGCTLIKNLITYFQGVVHTI